MAVDIMDFTNPIRTRLHQTTMHDGLYHVLRQAFDEAGVQWELCDVEDRGDGALILVPPELPKGLLADRLSNRLLAGLLRYNAVHSEEAAIQLRVALHAGEVDHGANGKVGTALNFTFRILDAQAAKTDLLQSRGVLAMIASDHFYQEVIAADPATGPTSFRQIPVSVKRTRDIAWLRVFGAAVVSAESRVLDVLPDIELERLRELLTGVSVPQLSTLVVRAAGPGVPSMRRDASAWEAVRYLLDFNACADGFPPVLTFVELLARQVGGVLGADLASWNDAQVQRLRLVSALRSLRAANASPVDADLRLHLMVLVEHDGLDPDRYLLSHWRQDDPGQWPPARGEVRAVAFDDLERAVDELVVSAEAAWSGHQGEIALEFVLPRALLNMPVHRWCKERNSGDPRPLSLDYPVVVRSLERMTSPHWHRVWRNRWRTLVVDPSMARVYFPRPAETDEPYRIDVALKDPQLVSMVLSGAPSPQVEPGDELSAALRSGLPAVLWHRGDCSMDVLRTLVTRLAESGGLGDLPPRALSARQAAYGGSLDQRLDPNAIHNLVVLWDDPRRLVILDQPPRPRRLEGGTADERGRAS
ncbi:MAG: hypothetical protein ACRDQ5_19145 [Sciscionella sp.]